MRNVPAEGRGRVLVQEVGQGRARSLANRCMDTRRLQHYLGHASITNTVIYTKMSPFKDIWRKPR